MTPEYFAARKANAEYGFQPHTYKGKKCLRGIHPQTKRPMIFFVLGENHIGMDEENIEKVFEIGYRNLRSMQPGREFKFRGDDWYAAAMRKEGFIVEKDEDGRPRSRLERKAA